MTEDNWIEKVIVEQKKLLDENIKYRQDLLKSMAKNIMSPLVKTT